MSAALDDIPLKQRLAARGVDGLTLLVVSGGHFPAAALHLPVPVRAGAVVQSHGRRRLCQLQPLLLGIPSFTDDRDDPLARFAGDAADAGLRRADRLPGSGCCNASGCSPTLLVFPITLGPFWWHRGCCLSRSAGLVQPQPDVDRPDFDADQAPAQLLGRDAVAGDHGLPLHLPFDAVLPLGHRSALEKAAATLGAGPWERFKHILFPLLLPGLAITFCLSFVQAFSVFPSAVLLGAPAGPTRVISIAAYQAAFEEYDYSLASAIAMIMGMVQLSIVVLVLSLRRPALSRAGRWREGLSRWSPIPVSRRRSGLPLTGR